MSNIKPILQHYADYVSNPKCDEWNNPFSVYAVEVHYKSTHEPTGTNHTGKMRVKHSDHADEIIAYWNKQGDDWFYERI